MKWEDVLLKVLHGRWPMVASNLTVAAIMLGATYFQDNPSFWRDLNLVCSGTMIGYALMWAMKPALDKKWRNTMEREIAIMTAQTFHRITKEALNPESRIYSIVPDDTPSTHGRTH